MDETTTAVKERPILFSGPMVKAILDGKKTQTRRVVKPQPGKMEHVDHDKDRGWHLWWDVGTYYGDHDQHYHDLRCPYGEPGDRLWVRETWKPCLPDIVEYKADGARIRHTDCDKSGVVRRDCRWRPSIHMPRVFSRLTLKVTWVRVERVRDISEADAKAEGVDASSPRQAAWNHRLGFKLLWDKINGKRPGCSWEANPWVWVVTFQRLEPQDG